MALERLGGFDLGSGGYMSLFVVGGYAFLEVQGPGPEYSEFLLTRDNLHALEAMCRRAKRRELKC